MALPPRVAAPIMEVFKSGRRVRGGLLRTLATALCGVLLLGGLAWALTQDQSALETSGSEEASSTEEEAVPATAQEVPELYYASEAVGALADDAGLEIGDRNEASDAAVPTGYAIEQDPEAGTTADEGTAVDVAVSTGSPQPPATQGAAPSIADSKQAPAAVRAAPEAAPNGVDADPRQEARAAQASSTTSQTASTSPVSDKTEKKGKKSEKKRKQ